MFNYSWKKRIVRSISTSNKHTVREIYSMFDPLSTRVLLDPPLVIPCANFFRTLVSHTYPRLYFGTKNVPKKVF